jgi:hypothetical protein
MMKSPMNLKHRKNIVRRAKRLIKDEEKDFELKHRDEQEAILDSYVERVCIELGWTLVHFYCEEGKVLEKLLKIS